jgi:hypothetical protein
MSQNEIYTQIKKLNNVINDLLINNGDVYTLVNLYEQLGTLTNLLD